MAKPDRQQSPEIRRSEQAVQNWSFDEVYKVLSTVGLAEYANALYRLQADSDGNLKVNIASGTVDVDTTGLATETKQDDIITELQTIVPQTDALTDTQLRATPVSVSGTVTATPTGTQNVDVTANTIGLATAANQQTDALTDTELRATPVVVDLGANNDVTVTSGTVTANLSSTDNAVLDNIDANTAPTTGLNTGRKVVTTAGTAVALASSTTCKWVAITAETDNTSTIVIGDSGVIASLSTREGVPLGAGDSIVIPIDNLADVYIDSLVNGEGVTFLYGT